MRTAGIFLRAFLAGIMISIGGAVYLASQVKIAGAFLFGVGLFIILCRGYALFTGAVGYALTNDRRTNFELPVILAGNLAGTAACGYAVRLTRLGAVADAAEKACSVKLEDGLLSAFILSVFCGVLMFAAVDTFKKQEHGILKTAAVFFCVAAFIVAGFEHVVANMFYFAAAGMFRRPEVWLKLLVMAAGNSVGAMLVSGAETAAAGFTKITKGNPS